MCTIFRLLVISLFKKTLLTSIALENQTENTVVAAYKYLHETMGLRKIPFFFLNKLQFLYVVFPFFCGVVLGGGVSPCSLSLICDTNYWGPWSLPMLIQPKPPPRIWNTVVGWCRDDLTAGWNRPSSPLGVELRHSLWQISPAQALVIICYSLHLGKPFAQQYY